VTDEATAQRTEVEFSSGGVRCAGWIYRPAGNDADIPCVVMAHGFSLTRHDGLNTYAEALAATGAAVLVYDHRFLGDSDGEPRQRIRICEQHQDRRSAIAFARARTGSIRRRSLSGATR
jgi:fermentation-respiration switch protein FrsA (DUF1100 family)